MGAVAMLRRVPIALVVAAAIAFVPGRLASRTDPARVLRSQ